MYSMDNYKEQHLTHRKTLRTSFCNKCISEVLQFGSIISNTNEALRYSYKLNLCRNNGSGAPVS